MTLSYNTNEHYIHSKDELYTAINSLSVPTTAPRQEVIDLMRKANSVYKKNFTNFHSRCVRYDQEHERDFSNLKTDLVNKFNDIDDLKKQIPTTTAMSHVFSDRSVKKEFKMNTAALKTASLSQSDKIARNSSKWMGRWFFLDSISTACNVLFAIDLTYLLFG